jgi:hypothetical protein
MLLDCVRTKIHTVSEFPMLDNNLICWWLSCILQLELLADSTRAMVYVLLCIDVSRSHASGVSKLLVWNIKDFQRPAVRGP